MGKFTSHNLSVIQKRVGKAKTSNAFTSQIGQVLAGVADWVLGKAYNEIPVDTWNLMEGTGIGVYVNGILTSFRYDELATQPRDGHWGRDTLTKALSAGASRFASGVWIVAFSTMPYAAEVDEWSGFFSEVIVEELEDLVLSEFKLK